jgi:hexokinase
LIFSPRHVLHGCPVEPLYYFQERSTTIDVEIPSAVYTGTVAEMYVFIAKKVVAFAMEQQAMSTGKDGLADAQNGAEVQVNGTFPPIGFCFSFPTTQTNIRG